MNGRRREQAQLAMTVVESNRCSILVPTVDTLSKRTRAAGMPKVRGWSAVQRWPFGRYVIV